MAKVLRPKPIRKITPISKLLLTLSQGLLGRTRLENLIKQIYTFQKDIIRFIKERRTIKILHIFRNYSALIVVISSAILVSATNLSAGKDTSGFLFGYLGYSEDNYSNPLENKLFIEAGKNKDLALVPLAQASTAPDPNMKADDPEQLAIADEAFVIGNSPVRDEPEEEGGVAIYEVQNGDTLSGIASKFKVTVNTILWANEIDNIDSIKPGDKVFILPTSGLSHTVKKGDTIDSIATKYKTDKSKIIAFNDLIATGEVTDGQELIIPDGQKEIIRPAVPTPASSTGIAARQYETFESIGKKLSGKAGTGHKFPYGYCTWYVSQKRYVPWSGNAGTWLYKAKSMGYATGKAPRPGAIIVTTEDKRYGHVALVEKVNGGTITVSEMNYVGWGKKSSRTLDAGSRVIKGYIY